MWELSVAPPGSTLKLFSNLDEYFSTLKACGFGAVCPDESPPAGYGNEYYDDLLKASKKSGVKINMIHLPYVVEVRSEVFLGKEFFEKTKKFIGIAERLGCKYAVVHPLQAWKYEFFRPEEKFDYDLIRSFCEEVNFEFFRKIGPYAVDAGIGLAIENVFTTDEEYREQLPSCCSDFDEWIKYIDELGEGFCACLDTGHANLTDRDNDKINLKAEKLGQRLKTLHIHENYAKFLKYGDFHQFPFNGDLDLISFAKTLKKIGYDGDFNYEVLFAKADKDVFVSQLKYLKAATDYIYKSI